MSLKPSPVKNTFNQQQIVILTSLKNSRVRFVNKMAEYYTSVENTSGHKVTDFYKNFLHPEDYSGYIAHLNSLVDDEEKETHLRLKNREGSWSLFRFRNRLYKGMSVKNQPVVLSLANEIINTGGEGSPEGQDKDSHDSHFRNFVESFDDAFCVVELLFDKKGKAVDFLFIETNPAFEIQNPYYKNPKGKTIKELNPSANNNFEYLHEVVQKGKPVRFQRCLEELEHSWFEIYAYKIGGEHSSRVGMFFRNITQGKTAEEELKQAKLDLEIAKKALEQKAIRREKALKESRELLQTVFDTTNQAVAVFKTLYNRDKSIKDFKYIKVNKILLDMYLDNDPTGLTYLKTSKYGVEMGVFDALKKVVKTGEPLDNEFYFDKDGYHHWFRMTARSQKNLLIATIEDISERKADAAELQENLRFRQELGRTSQETILIVNLDTFKVRYISRDLFPESGITREKVEGMPLLEIFPFIHPRDREKLMQLHKRIVKSSSEEVFEIEIRARVDKTSWEWFNVRGKIFLRRDANWVEEYVLLVTNITDQKNTEKALLNAEKLSIKGEVARTLAHELRNPIASIGMVGQVLSIQLKQDNLKKYTGILSRSAKTLNDLVTSLLTSSNYSPSVLQQEDLADIVKRSIDKASDRIYLAGITLKLNFKGPYPVLADAEKLEIALVNILVNASEATVPGEGIIKIMIKEHKEELELAITDNGCGLEQKQIDRLFDAFYTNKSMGLGVGLSSVKTILEEHDARIKVESKVNKGSTFRLFFTLSN